MVSTPQTFNIAHENGPSRKESLPTIVFQGLLGMLNFGCEFEFFPFSFEASKPKITNWCHLYEYVIIQPEIHLQVKGDSDAFAKTCDL